MRGKRVSKGGGKRRIEILRGQENKSGKGKPLWGVGLENGGTNNEERRGKKRKRGNEKTNQTKTKARSLGIVEQRVGRRCAARSNRKPKKEGGWDLNEDKRKKRWKGNRGTQRSCRLKKALVGGRQNFGS